MTELSLKYKNLVNYLKTLENAGVAFSSGVDSTYLLKVAHDVLGDSVTAFTAKSALFPKRELEEAEAFCKKEGIRHVIVDMDIDLIQDNPTNRCYICKRNMFEQFLKTAKFSNIQILLEGSNIDDEKDYRPGMMAIDELGIKSPLKLAGLSKNEIRILSKDLGLKTFDKPSFACLASRIAYGEKITEEKLDRIQNAEQFLYDLGFTQFRVRLHGELARIEVLPVDFGKLVSHREDIISKLKELGFKYISMDLEGYRTGSMNDSINFK